MIKLFLSSRIPDKRFFILFEKLNAESTLSNSLFQVVDTSAFSSLYELVDAPEKSDFFAIPYPFFSVRKEEKYIDDFITLAEQHKKRVVVFAYGDSSEKITSLPESAIIFRTSAYKSELQSNEYIMPAYVEDLGKLHGINPRVKGTLPTVGFVGQARFRGFVHRIKYYAKSVVVGLTSTLFPSRPCRHGGLYYRRKMIRLLSRSALVNTRFILRRSFSGNKKSIEGNPDRIRREYIENMFESDFVLAPRGDGNYSLRFFEGLSMGRVPILLDTDIALPLENLISYDDAIIRIPLKDIDRSAEIISRCFAEMKGSDFIGMQEKARAIFERYLDYRAFWPYAFRCILAPLI